MNMRQHTLQHWLTQDCQLHPFELYPMTGDASFRRYFRIQQPGRSYVAMDAPPERENCVPFVAIANALRELGLFTPEIVGQDISRGFLLLSDLGDQLYLNALSHLNAEKLYASALDALAILQTCRQVDGWTVPLFTADFMYHELELFQEWFLVSYLKLTLTPKIQKILNKFFRFLSESAAAQPQVFMHRDFHSANLMVLPDDKVGILDFQDAFIGPVTYDLVSLLRDCYISFPENVITKLVLSYQEKLQKLGMLKDISVPEFLRWFDLMGMQRHLKALLTFSRKYKRDNNSNYLQHIPRTLDYLLAVSQRYPECQEFNLFLRELPCAE